MKTNKHNTIIILQQSTTIIRNFIIFMKMILEKVDRAHMLGENFCVLFSREITWLWRGVEMLI